MRQGGGKGRGERRREEAGRRGRGKKEAWERRFEATTSPSPERSKPRAAASVLPRRFLEGCWKGPRKFLEGGRQRVAGGKRNLPVDGEDESAVEEALGRHTRAARSLVVQPHVVAEPGKRLVRRLQDRVRGGSEESPRRRRGRASLTAPLSGKRRGLRGRSARRCLRALKMCGSPAGSASCVVCLSMSVSLPRGRLLPRFASHPCRAGAPSLATLCPPLYRRRLGSGASRLRLRALRGSPYGEMWGDVGRCGEMWGDVGGSAVHLEREDLLALHPLVLRPRKVRASKRHVQPSPLVHLLDAG